ncbi:MAG: esterase-like activity of phytase family protein [Caulobacteraceae bacterium]
MPPGAPAQNTPARHYLTGRSDNFGPKGSADPAQARFDPEGVRVSADGKSVFVSDEYGPYLRRFDRATGRLIRTYALPADLAVFSQSPNGKAEISGNASGRTANKGMEGLAITPDGETLVGMMQEALLQDAGDPASARLLRIVTVDVKTGAAREYGYKLTAGSGVSEIVAINSHEFLVDERDGKGLGDKSAAKVKQLFRIDIAGAKDITGLKGAEAAASLVQKSAAPVLDIVAALAAHGVAADQVPAKIEGLAFGPDVRWQGKAFHTLFIANDNDFVPDESGPNRFFVFGFESSDLPRFVAQTISKP